MRKKLLAVLMSVVMVMSLAACSSGEKTTGNSTETSSVTNGAQEDPTEIIMTFPVLSSIPADINKVEEALSKIALEKYNCTIKLNPLSIVDYGTQTTLMLSGSEKMDLMILFSPIQNYISMVQMGQLIDITDYLSQYAQGALDAVGEDYLIACRIDGQLYGVPTLHDFATGFGIEFDKSLVEKYNMDLTAVKTFSDLEPLFETIKENEEGVAAFYPGGSSQNPLNPYMNATMDTLGDTYGVLLNSGAELTVENVYASDEYYNMVSMYYNWGKNGYLLNDSASTTDSSFTLFKAGKIFAAPATTKPGQVQQDSTNSGKDLVLVEIKSPSSMTTAVNGIQWAVPRSAENPQKSVKVLNLLYTNADFVNLLNYGIEGEHYVVNENGQISQPEGVTAETNGYSWGITFLSGNEFIAYTRDNEPADLWEQTKEFNNTATKSKAMGFVFDGSNVKAETTAVANVVSEYRVGLENGALDPDKYIPEFLAKLEAAGINKIIEEKQSQLDAWATSK